MVQKHNPAKRRYYKKKKANQRIRKKNLAHPFKYMVTYKGSSANGCSPIPPAFRTTFKYAWNGGITGAASRNSYSTFIDLNSPVLPTYQFPSGGQMGIDEAATYNAKQCAGWLNFMGQNQLYQNAHVLNAKIKVIASPLSVSDSCNVTIAPLWRGDGTTYASQGAIAQGPFSRTKVVMPDVPQKDRECTFSCNIPSMIGVDTKAYLEDLNYSAVATVSPNIPYVLTAQIYINTINGSNFSSTPVMPVRYEVEYDVVMHHPVSGGLLDA